MTLDARELSTVLAALRHFQRSTPEDDRAAWPQFGDDVEPLDNDEIDELCERLNVDAE
jgi:hypothetical protein